MRGCAVGLAIRVLASLFALLLMTACATRDERGDFDKSTRNNQMSPQECVQTASTQRVTSADGMYLIQAGDELAIAFYLNPEFNQDVIVRPDGRIALEMVGTMQASGHTPEQVAQQIDRAYLQELRSPGATVTVKNMPSRQVFVEGEVNRPGAFPADSGMTAIQAVAEAGGFTADASKKVVLIRRDACGQSAREIVNLAGEETSSNDTDDLVLQSRDVVIATPSAIANIDQWIDHYIRRLLPVQPYMATATPPL